MSSFVSEEAGAKGSPDNEGLSSTQMIDFAAPVQVIYCPTCSMPCEFCEYGACFSKCLPWIMENCREALSAVKLAEVENSAGGVTEGLEGEKKKEKPKGGGAAAPKKATILETKVIITRVQRQKRKFVTVVGGLETVPDLKIKDASRTFGKKFSSGCSVNESQTGAKEVVIQGDVLFDLPAILMSEFKVAAEAIFILEDGSLRPFR